jgi:hypothetical protein
VRYIIPHNTQFIDEVVAMKKLIVLCLVALFVLNYSRAEAADVWNSVSFKLTIYVNGEELEWEYLNPDEFEFEKGTTVYKNNEVQKQIEKLFSELNISEKAKVKDMVKHLKEKGYRDMDRLDVRWMNSKEELFTWVWESKQ